MTPILLALVVQVTGWTVSPGQATVGDTVRLVREFAVEAGAHARLEPMQVTEQIQPLLDPLARASDGTLTVHYVIAVFQPGRVAVAMPAVEVQYPDGRAVVFPADTVVVDVSSVLPQLDSLPDPKLSLGPLARHRTRWWPLVTLVAVTLVGVTVWGVKRRRPKLRPPWMVPVGDPVPIADEHWAKAGEARAVAAAVSDALRLRIATVLPVAARHLTVEECLEVIGRERPKWPLRDLGEVLRSLERARFAPAVPDGVWELGHRADALVRQLRAGNGDGET